MQFIQYNSEQEFPEVVAVPTKFPYIEATSRESNAVYNVVIFFDEYHHFTKMVCVDNVGEFEKIIWSFYDEMESHDINIGEPVLIRYDTAIEFCIVDAGYRVNWFTFYQVKSNNE